MADLTSRIKSLPAEKQAEVKQLLQEKLAAQQALAQAQYDVVILGGGFAGATLARQLKQVHPDIRILVVDKLNYPVREAAFKVGESTVEIGAFYLRDVLGLKEHLETDQIVKAGLRYFFPAGDNSDITRRTEVGLKNFPPIQGYQVDRGRLENLLYKENIEQGIEVWAGSKVESVDFNTVHHVTLSRNKQVETVSARWVIDATGRTGLLKRQLGMAQTIDHDINSVWFRVGDTLDVTTWSDNTDWQTRVAEGIRWVGTSHLMGPGYWVWIICLASNVTSVGIVADAKLHPHQEMNRLERAIDWLRQHEPECAKVIEEREHLIQDFMALKHYTHGCQTVFSNERWGITGEAGLFGDPFYSPGADFIATNNSLLTDLIVRDLKGEDIKSRLEYCNFTYINFFKQYLVTYKDQYSLMGNTQVMLAKIIWDWVIYWGVTALLFFHDNKLFDQEWVNSVGPSLQRFNQLNNRMQPFFNEWGKFDQQDQQDVFFDIMELGFLEELLLGLTAGLDDEALKVQFAKNVDLLEAIAKGIYDYGVKREATILNNGNGKEAPQWKPLHEIWLADNWSWQTKTEIPSDLNKIWL